MADTERPLYWQNQLKFRARILFDIIKSFGEFSFGQANELRLKDIITHAGYDPAMFNGPYLFALEDFVNYMKRFLLMDLCDGKEENTDHQ